jgi:hypothetical protein
MFTDLYGAESGTLQNYFDEVVLQHVPDYVFGEPIAVEIETTDSRIFLRRSYQAFVDRLTELSAPWESLVQQRRALSLAAIVETVRETLATSGRVGAAESEELLRTGYRILEHLHDTEAVEDGVTTVLEITRCASAFHPSTAALLAEAALERIKPVADKNQQIYASTLQQAVALFEQAGLLEKATQYRRQHAEHVAQLAGSDSAPAIDAARALEQRILPVPGLPTPVGPALHIFISYASEDRDIALAVGEALKAALHDDFAEINLDKWFLEAGVEFAAQIRRKLEQTDIFIIISTGMEKESHSFTGMEVGYFMRVMEGRPGRMVPLFLRAAPATMSSVQGIGIGFDSKVLNLLPEAFDAQNDVAPTDPMVSFVVALQKRVDEVRASIGLRPVTLRPEQNPIVCVKTMRRKIFQILRKKAEIAFRPQKQVLFTTTDAAFIKSRPDLPADARLQPDPSGSPMSIFGLPDVDMTWESFLSSISDSEYCDSWRQAITNVISSSFPDRINSDNSQVVTSAGKTKRYRIILTACTKYFDDRREFSLCFVEDLRRKDFGDNDTSLLLKALDIVCRFRFLLLEGDSEFSHNTISLTKPSDLPGLAHSLIRELDLLERDARDAGLHKTNVWSNFVDWSRLSKMVEEYQPQEQALREVAARILTAQDNREVLTTLGKELAGVVHGIEVSMRPINSLLAHSITSKLQETLAD